ncbi:MAG: prepilin-type N-terminal cleavage/methylation domain-containing protein [Candidatus Riflebacteria bacterium]|nr:prepilin-type N-terminal cleavage/methylation domain-containing protein [Candidatus Riflebacteria bacterium]
MRNRLGFSLVEILVVLVVGALLLYVAYNGLVLLRRSERSIDREASRAIMEARVLELLMHDIRSSWGPVSSPGDGEYRLVRAVMVDGELKAVAVTWRMRDGGGGQSAPVLVRTVEGQRPQEFRFSGLVKPDEPRFAFRIEDVPDGLFTP